MDNSSARTCDLLIAHADLLVPLAGDDLPGGWLAVQDGFVQEIGKAGDEPAW
jgi:8-oxoguanine deaminase